jgi:hypothetical protein
MLTLHSVGTTLVCLAPASPAATGVKAKDTDMSRCRGGHLGTRSALGELLEPFNANNAGLRDEAHHLAWGRGAGGGGP